MWHAVGVGVPGWHSVRPCLAHHSPAPPGQNAACLHAHEGMPPEPMHAAYSYSLGGVGTSMQKLGTPLDHDDTQSTLHLTTH